MWSLMITSAHSSIFLPSKNLFLYGINLISEIFYARGLLTMMIRIIYIQNDSLLSNWSIYNVLGFKLIKLVRLIPIPILLWPIYHLQPPPPVDISHIDIAPNPYPSPTLLIPPNQSTSPYPLVTLLRRSTRANHGTWTNTRYQDEVFYYSVIDP